MMPKIVHPQCEPSCTHHLVLDRGGVIVQRRASLDRQECEDYLAVRFVGQPIEYLGIGGPGKHNESADPWLVHYWLVGARPRVTRQTERKVVVTEDKSAIYRRDVWLGSGQPLPALDFSRKAPEGKTVKVLPAPVRASLDPLAESAPGPVVDLLMWALAKKWDARITHSIGHVPGQRSEDPKVLWAVRCVRGNRHAVAVRVDDAWKSLWVWSGEQFFTRLSGLGEFREALV